MPSTSEPPPPRTTPRQPSKLEPATPPPPFVYSGLIRIAGPLFGFRHRAQLAKVQSFCLFVGEARSGHSLVGAMLNAHPDCVCAHEARALRLIERGLSRRELFGQILAKAFWFHLRKNQGTYSYSIPSGWQGRFRSLQVVGDKRGGETTRLLMASPGLLQRARECVGVPLRLVRIIRCPFDNIAAQALASGRTLAESIDDFTQRARFLQTLPESCLEGELLTLHHEDFFSQTKDLLERLCLHFDLDLHGQWASACADKVFAAPTRTSEKMAWTATDIERVHALQEELPDFERYRGWTPSTFRVPAT